MVEQDPHHRDGDPNDSNNDNNDGSRDSKGIDDLWRARALKELRGQPLESLDTLHSSGLWYRGVYTNTYSPEYPGVPPYTRGPWASMYPGKPWTIRQYAGFSSASQSNKFYRDNLAGGQKGLSVAFDLPTHRGYDSDHPRVGADVGKAGVAVDSVEDMKVLFKGIPLDQISVSMTMNGAVLPILACYIVAAEEQGVAPDQLRGTLQNDILKEYLVRNTFIYPPVPSMRIVGDILSYTSQNMPLFHGISISGYHMQEAGADSVMELAYTLANGLAYLDLSLERGMKVDDVAPRMSFFFGIGMNFFMEIAKLRAARKLWHDLVLPYAPQNPRSLMLRTHCQTSGYSLTAHDPYNNIIRTTIEAMAATLGGTQSLHTNAFDEALALPTPLSARLARNTQLILQHETDLCYSADPLGGSYFIETLTTQMYDGARRLIDEVMDVGGMVKALQNGLVKSRIEESAAAKQARIDSGEEKIIGVNCYPPPDRGEPIKVLEVDLAAVREAQSASLRRVREQRDGAAVPALLRELKDAAQDPQAPLMEVMVRAIRARATVGECSEALEEVFGRYQPPLTAVRGVYMSSYSGDQKKFQQIQERVRIFAACEGRRPRMLLVKLGQDGHDRGIKVVATALADFGFDVDLGPLFALPEEAGRQALENDVHIAGVSSLAGGHKTLVRDLRQYLDHHGGEHIHIIAGGVIPPGDYEGLRADGCRAIFGPGTPMDECAAALLELLGA